MIPGIVAQASAGEAFAGDPLWDYVVFLAFGEGADGSSVFYDRSKYARAMTTVGAAQVDTDITVASSPSIKFDSDANFIHRAYGDELNIQDTSGDFCMEAYVYCTNIAAGINQIFGRRRNSDNYIMQIDPSNLLQFSTFNGTTGTFRLSVAAGMSNNTVHHVAVIRVGTTYYGFVDGVLKGSNTSSVAMGASSTNLYLGQSEDNQATRFWRGNLNWMRITMGHQRYNIAGFTPPTVPFATVATPPTDAAPNPTFSNVKLLCGFNGADGATSFTEESSAARVASFFGNAQLDTAQSKFGTSSLLVDGTGDYITFPDAADLRIPTGSNYATDSFCIEAWVRIPSIKSGIACIATKRTSAGLNEFVLNLVDGKANFFTHLSGSGDVVSLNDQVAITTDAWHHIAASCSGPFARLFVDGRLAAVGTRRTTPGTNTSALHIGRDPFNTSRDFNGWIDEVRFTKGEPVYTGPFIPPTAAFPRS